MTNAPLISSPIINDDDIFVSLMMNDNNVPPTMTKFFSYEIFLISIDWDSCRPNNIKSWIIYNKIVCFR